MTLVRRSLADNWTPSALAGVAFPACCAGVRYVMNRPQPSPPAEDAAVDR